MAAAEQLDDPDLSARIIGAYDVPAIWPRVDDPEQADAVVSAAERTLARLPSDPDRADPIRARLWATIAVETRGKRDPRAAQSATEALRQARGLPLDPAADLGPSAPWAQPLLLLADGHRAAAIAALLAAPEPPPDLLQEAHWVLLAKAAVLVEEQGVAGHAARALSPAVGEIAGAAC